MQEDFSESEDATFGLTELYASSALRRIRNVVDDPEIRAQLEAECVEAESEEWLYNEATTHVPSDPASTATAATTTTAATAPASCASHPTGFAASFASTSVTASAFTPSPKASTAKSKRIVYSSSDEDEPDPKRRQPLECNSSDEDGSTTVPPPAAVPAPLVLGRLSGRKVLIPASTYPDEECLETEGRGWTARQETTAAASRDGKVSVKLCVGLWYQCVLPHR